MTADYRQKAFEAKFSSAGAHLGVAPDQIVSLKLRDMVTSYSEYGELLRVLKHEAGIQWSEIDGDFQGRGYLVHHDDQKIIVVGHETGLEILYIAGSIASLISLIPLVIRAWGSVRGFLDHRHAHHFHSVEIRRLDSDGKLCEDHSHGLADPFMFPLNVLSTALASAARVIDADVLALRKEVESLGRRLTAVEKEVKPMKTTSRRSNKTSGREEN